MANADEKVFSIVATLEAACGTLQAEIQAINADLAYSTEALQRYGDIYAPPVRYLTQLRENKLLRFREIIGQLEALKTQIDCSAKLLMSLNSNQPVTIVQSSPPRRL